MDDLLERITSTKAANCRMFAHELNINERLLRWVDERNPQHYNRNHFLAQQPLLAEDIVEIIEVQKRRGLQGFLLKSPWKLSDEIMDQYGLTEEKQLIWAQIEDKSCGRNINSAISIYDCQTEDISEQLRQLCLSEANSPNEKFWINRVVDEVLQTAKQNPNYHWLLACHEDKAVGRCYVFQGCGTVQMEDLWVTEAMRKQRVATTLLQYIQEHFDGVLFLHSEAQDSVSDMYRKLGFEIVGEQYEYSLVWRN